MRFCLKRGLKRERLSEVGMSLSLYMHKVIWL